MKKNMFISYIGGKSCLVDKIVPLFPEEKNTYCEVFGGALWILLNKPPHEIEIINDINSLLVNLYRVIKYHAPELIRHLKGIPPSRIEFEKFINENPKNLTDVQNAVRSYYLSRTCYGGKFGDGQTFVLSQTRPSNFNPLKFKRDLIIASRRLARVGIENLPYAKFIDRYDGRKTLFYLDPPYFGCEDYYGKGIFSREDFIKLAAILAEIKGSFALSLNDLPEVRKIFEAFNFHDLSVRYSISGKNQSAKEVLITNY